MSCIQYNIIINENKKIILLINGGDKSQQSKDIERAQELLNQWRLSND